MVGVLVSRIECKILRKVKVEVDPGLGDGLQSEIGHDVQIFVPNRDHFPEGAVLHELLHARRFHIDGVPQFVVCDLHEDVKLGQLYQAIENNLEHLIVVAEERSLRPDRCSRRISKVERTFALLEA